MNARELIEKKKRGGTLSAREIRALIEGFTAGQIPDYQMAAFLMAVWFRGLDTDETRELTACMMRSGMMLDLAGIPGPRVDKHSTGGIGDKVSLPLVGIAAACGLRVPMISGRGLGHTGGTLDKLESIPGYSTQFDPLRFREQLERVGAAIVGQSDDLVPADRALYALRDVTATVDCIPLIVASILSKKFAADVEAVVLDVKVGSGAFMRTLEQARELAQALIDTAASFDRRLSVVFTRMDEPLGRTVGNALEVQESVALLRGEGPEDLQRLTLALVAEMLQLGGVARDARTGLQRAAQALGSGAALEHFRRLVEHQGGRLDWDAAGLGLEIAPVQARVEAPAEAYLAAVDGYAVGMAVVELGGGRLRKEDAIDHGVGLRWHARIGDRVEPGHGIVEVHARNAASAGRARERLENALTWSSTPTPAPPWILGRMDGTSGFTPLVTG